MSLSPLLQPTPGGRKRLNNCLARDRHGVRPLRSKSGALLDWQPCTKHQASFLIQAPIHILHPSHFYASLLTYQAVHCIKIHNMQSPSKLKHTSLSASLHCDQSSEVVFQRNHSQDRHKHPSRSSSFSFVCIHGSFVLGSLRGADRLPSHTIEELCLQAMMVWPL